MQYSQEHLKTMVYAEFGGQTECIMGNSKIDNWKGGHMFNLFTRQPGRKRGNSRTQSLPNIAKK